MQLTSFCGTNTTNIKYYRRSNRHAHFQRRDVIYQRREIVSHPNTEKRDEERRAGERRIFDKIRGVWIADETLSPVFDISSQSKQKGKRKRKSKIAKIYAN